MNEDSDFLQIRCPRCRSDFKEQIGRLREKLSRGDRIICPDCGMRIYANYQEFERVLRESVPKGGGDT